MTLADRYISSRQDSIHGPGVWMVPRSIPQKGEMSGMETCTRLASAEELAAALSSCLGCECLISAMRFPLFPMTRFVQIDRVPSIYVTDNATLTSLIFYDTTAWWCWRHLLRFIQLGLSKSAVQSGIFRAVQVFTRQNILSSSCPPAIRDFEYFLVPKPNVFS